MLYLHDITKDKVGGVGVRNLRLLEKIIGIEDFKNCTLVTTKWGCTNDPQGEEEREKVLSTDPRFFAGILKHATMKRFDPKTKGRALDIITPFLNNRFTLQITCEMVDPSGPKLALGETTAGKDVTDRATRATELAQSKHELAKAQQAQEILARKFDEILFEEFNQSRKKLRRKIKLQRSGRWIIRTTIVGGAIVATVLTLGPGASGFALEPMYEKVVSRQKKAEKKAKEDLKADFVKKSQQGSLLKETNPDWLDDTHVKLLKDLESYSLRSGSSESDVLQIARQGKVVGFAASKGSEALDAADLANYENSECSESDAEML